MRESVADSGEAGFGTGDELLVFFHCNRFVGLSVRFFKLKRVGGLKFIEILES